MIPLAVFGNFAIDDLVFANGTTRWGNAGGSAAYAALGAAVWTERIAIVAPLGADYPQAVLTGIDCRRCRGIPHTMRNWGLYETDGTRHFISRSRDRNWLAFCPSGSDVPADVQAAHLAPMPVTRALELARILRRNGAPLISADTDDHDLLGNEASLMKLLRAVDLFLPSEQDVQRLWPGISAASALQKMRDASPGTRLIVVKRGAEGVLAHIVGETTFRVVPSAARQVMDPTGAGDAFCGGVIAGYMEGESPADSLMQGALSAAWCVEGIGVQGVTSVPVERRNMRLAQEWRRLGTASLCSEPAIG